MRNFERQSVPAPADQSVASISSKQDRSAGSHLSLATSREIITPRLRLRPFEARDREALHEIVMQPESFAFPERPVPGPEDSWARLLRHVGHWAVLGFGLFAVELRCSGRVIGEVGFADFGRGVAPFHGAPEAAWTIHPDFWGQGYAVESARAAHQWIELQHGSSSSVCMIHQDNKRSLCVAAKLGYRSFASIIYRGSPVTLFRRIADDRRSIPLA